MPNLNQEMVRAKPMDEDKELFLDLARCLATTGMCGSVQLEGLE